MFINTNSETAAKIKWKNGRLTLFPHILFNTVLLKASPSSVMSPMKETG